MSSSISSYMSCNRSPSSFVDSWYPISCFKPFPVVIAGSLLTLVPFLVRVCSLGVRSVITSRVSLSFNLIGRCCCFFLGWALPGRFILYVSARFTGVFRFALALLDLYRLEISKPPRLTF